MLNYTNIEKSALRPGEYVGYALGPWRIKKAGSYWVATAIEDVYPHYILARTLSELSTLLQEMANKPYTGR